jgi:hypothetical protein
MKHSDTTSRTSVVAAHAQENILETRHVYAVFVWHVLERQHVALEGGEEVSEGVDLIEREVVKQLLVTPVIVYESRTGDLNQSDRVKDRS